eukprot:NODE_4511_length_575_cov_13.534221_g3276_i0.p3 GENE.NODE_4511_length_575_cov_13.534221_g3276_i0~~NODE_4511_length_575_cov_13.534221_g3276_i0.p3  ORF type:complete len:64 (-),score=3.22 NODE_4511_length_575_cov_13.534221_g3276_i0:153-344(-)
MWRACKWGGVEMEDESCHLVLQVQSTTEVDCGELEIERAKRNAPEGKAGQTEAHQPGRDTEKK